MDAGTLQVKNIFGQDRRHIVPMYQRPYVWNKDDQWDPFWSDISRTADRRLAGEDVTPHFFGAIVLDQLPQPTGHLESRLIIDGQQRLTTLQIFLEAVADLCSQTEQHRHAASLRKLTRNDDPMSDDDDEEFKVWPTNVDQDHFRRVMRAESPEALLAEYDRKPTASSIGHPLGDAYLYFYGQLRSWVEQNGSDLGERVEALYTTVRDDLRLVVIDLSPQDDPQLIFETLNARGTPLLPSDLVKNFLLHRARHEGADVEKLYKQFWVHFDEDDRYWREEIGRGHTKRARIDTFLQHYLQARTVDEVASGKLYATFQAFAGDTHESSAEKHLEAMCRYSKTYQSFAKHPQGSPEAQFFTRIDTIGLRTAYPFLLELYQRFGGHENTVRSVLSDLESFLIRRMICMLNTRGYNRLFVDLIPSLDVDAGMVAESVRDALLSGDSEASRWPNDAEFREAWMRVPAYRRHAQYRIRLILEALEAALRTKKTEGLRFENDLTIEHLMPVNWREHWPLPRDLDETEAIETRESLIHTFGNLSLLTNSLNPSVSNGPWEQKREGILEHSALSLNRKLKDFDVLDEKAIAERGMDMFKAATKVWTYPG